MGSITEQNDLDDLMTVAYLAGKEFTAERGSASFVQAGSNPITAGERNYAIPTDEAAKEWIRIPRKPKWEAGTTKEELHRLEQESFLAWRRQLALIEEAEHFILTPFERNLDIWRQLWRVVELSDVIVQIVDARNPEVFFCPDLVTYAADVDAGKTSLLLLNKADLLTDAQRELWAGHLAASGIEFVFFSALSAGEEGEAEEEEAEGEPCGVPAPNTCSPAVLSRPELLALFAARWGGKTVGLVGYPNVGKSSTINCLLGEKKVAVAITPGKTKHYQTLFLPNGCRVCDCPGLVFPNFSLSRSELVLNGILPVDQLRDWVSPASLLAERVPRDVIERLYGIQLPLPGPEEDATRTLTAAELLCSFARARGFMTSNHGNPDQSRAARIILKDYVAGKLLYCHAPPGAAQSEYSALTHRSQRAALPLRSNPRPHKPNTEVQDEHLLATSVGFVARKTGNVPVYSSSKKHYKRKA